MSSWWARLRPDSSEVGDVGAMLLLTVVALVAFESSYGGSTYLVLGTIAAVIGAAVAYVTARLGVSAPVFALLAVAVYALVGGVVALPEHAVAGVLPSVETVTRALTVAVTGWKDLVTTAPPVGRTGDLMLLPVFAGMASGAAGVAMALRLPVALPALVAPVAVLVAGIVTGTDEPVSLLLHGTVFGGVSIAWLAWRARIRRPLLQGGGGSTRRVAASGLLLLVSMIGGTWLAPSLPMADRNDRTVWRESVVPPFDPREHPSPLAGYRAYVKADDADDIALFRIEGLPEGLPVRLATMDAFDGLVWQVSAGVADDPSLSDSGSFERVGVSLEPEFEGVTADVTITIGAYNDVWVPDVGEVIGLRFTGSADGDDRDRELAEAFRYNRSTDTGTSRVRLRQGDRYEMTVRLPVTLDDLANEEVIPTMPRLGNARTLQDLTETFAGPELLAIDDTGSRLDHVRDEMVQAGTYSDGDLQAGQLRARAGHSAGRLVDFVRRYPEEYPLVGNAEQYTAAYALLFRELDRVPTRVVMGFLPSAGSVDAPVEVVASQVEAWVEVPIEDQGWVGIFPTPSREQTSILNTPQRQPFPDYRTQNPPPPPLIDPEFDQPATASGEAQSPDDILDDAVEDEDILADTGDTWWSSRVVEITALALSPFVAVALASLFVVWLKLRRRSRRRRTGDPHERIANGWEEMTDAAVDMGRPVPATTTRREAAAFVGVDARSFAERADAAVWNVGEPDDADVDRYWDDLVRELQSMRSQLGLLDRFRSWISLQSFRVRRRRAAGKGDDG